MVDYGLVRRAEFDLFTTIDVAARVADFSVGQGSGGVRPAELGFNCRRGICSVGGTGWRC